MSLAGSVRVFAVGVLAAASLALAACGERESAIPAGAPKEIVFSIQSAQGQASAGPLWRPLLDDLSKAVGVPVRPHFASTYSALIDDMKRGETQVAWFSPQPAVEAVDQAGAEVIARTVNPEGADSYYATLIVRKGSGVTLEDVLACGRRYSFGMGDPQSTSGALAPMTFLFGPRDIKPDECFASVRSDTHESNAFQVASGVLDVSASNSVGATTLRRQNPTIADQIEQIWQSPPIPEGGILVRGDLDPAVKEKIRSFFLTYGQGSGVEAERQRQVLAGLNYSRFNAADEDYLDPVREMMASQALAAAEDRGDRRAIAEARQELQRLRAKREVQP